jgi:hypothetical protein
MTTMAIIILISPPKLPSHQQIPTYRQRVDIAVDSYCAYAEPSTRLDHTTGNLTSVGYKHFFKILQTKQFSLSKSVLRMEHIHANKQKEFLETIETCLSKLNKDSL